MIPPKGETRKELNDKVVTPLDEGEGIYDGDIIKMENFPDKVYDVLDNIDIDMEVNAT